MCTVGMMRKMFHPHEEEIWAQLSRELEGEFENHQGWSQDRILVKDGQWTVTLDVHSEPGYRAEIRYTRYRAPYVNADGFRFNLYQETVFSEVAARFSHDRAEAGHAEIDKLFTIKTNNPDKLKQLFDSSRLRALLAGEPAIHLFVRQSDGAFAAEFPDGVDELALEVEGEVTDLERLKSLYVLFATVLQRLCAIGSAYEDDPHVEL